METATRPKEVTAGKSESENAKSVGFETYDDMNLTDNLIEYSNASSNENSDNDKDYEKEIEALGKTETAIPKTHTPIIVQKTVAIAKPNQTKPIPIKIAAKPINTQALTKVSAVKSSGGKIVIIQTPGGGQQSIRLANNTTTSVGPGQGYHLIKTSEGNIIQIRNKNTQNATSTNIKQIITPQHIQNSGGKFIYKGITLKGNESKILLSTAPTKITSATTSTTSISTTSNGNPTASSITKTIPLVEALQLGILGPGKIKHIMLSQKGKPPILQPVKTVPKILPVLSTSPSSLPSPQSLTNAIKKIAPIQPKITIPILKTGTQTLKKVTMPGMIKVSSGNIVSMGGKGLQCLRFVTVSPSSSTTTTTTTGKLISSTKLGSSTPSITPLQQKFIIQGKSGQTVTVVQNQSGNQPKVVTVTQQQLKSSNLVQTAGKVLQTISMPKKISQLNKIPIISVNKTTENQNVVPQKLIAVVKKDDNTMAEGVATKVTTLTPSQLSQLQGTSIIPGNKQSPPIVMLPSNFVQQLKEKSLQIKQKEEEQQQMKNVSIVKIRTEIEPIQTIEDSETDMAIENSKNADNGRKKPCNCTRSQCLKLYCDCFANGEFCSNCNCRECFNNLENEDERQKAIRLCLERNPNAFRPKIGKAKDKDQALRSHNKGCNCKRSGCMKNYCECYEAKISCSSNCKCYGCRNNEEYFERPDCANEEYKPATATIRKIKRSVDSVDKSEPPTKQPYNFMTPDVIDATVQCMVAQAEECQRKGFSPKLAEKLILEEFGRCLVEIIDFSIRNTDND